MFGFVIVFNIGIPLALTFLDRKQFHPPVSVLFSENDWPLRKYPQNFAAFGKSRATQPEDPEANGATELSTRKGGPSLRGDQFGYHVG